MLRFLLRRLVYMAVTLAAVSVIVFIVIQLPPGDFLTSYIARYSEQGGSVDASMLESLRAQYGLGQPWYVQYWRWISNIVTAGDFGQSFEWNRPVSSLLWDRLGMTLLLSFITLIVTWALSLPVGIYSAVRRYSTL